MPKQAKSSEPQTRPTKTSSAISKAAKGKEIAKDDTRKKKVVLPKRNAPTKESKSNNEKTLDMCLILDCTASMGSWIQRSKDTLKTIIDQAKVENPSLKVRVSFVGYRDFGYGNKQYSVIDFSEDLDIVKSFISKQDACSSPGNDWPEDVQGGLHKALGMSWEKDSIRSVFHIADAPGHGKDICDWGDRYPDGSPDGHKIQD